MRPYMPWSRLLRLTGGIALLALGCSAGSGETSAGSGGGGVGAAGAGGSATGGGGNTSASSGASAGGGGAAECTDNDGCDEGEVCKSGVCVVGCAADKPCESGSCCDGACVDVATDLENCGACGKVCPTPENIATSCEAGLCSYGACAAGYYDCDGDVGNGCESSTACNCTPGTFQDCYPGPPDTEGVGPCKKGTRKCNAEGSAWSLCSGFVTPSAELCGTGVDENCDGTADNVPDLDGDGWTACQGDCCETAQDCSNPAKVNPGAFEFVGNGIDDDCDPATSDTVAAPTCSTVGALTGVTPQLMAQAIDICQTTTANAPLPQRKWGLINAVYRFANGATPSGAQLTTMQSWQAAVMTQYGTNSGIAQNLPRKGPTMAGISTGRMRYSGQNGYVNPNNGTSFPGHSHQPPAAYLAAHNNALPASAGCSGSCPSGSGAFDSINLRLSIRVPTNAQSFSYQFRYLSSEYWCFSCTAFNDFFLALLQTAAPGIPADKNISFDAKGNPLSVNNGFYDVCQVKGCHTCPGGLPSAQLPGTGMQLADNGSQGCLVSPGGQTGGGTLWLKTTAPIVPGETMQLELMVFDVSDNILDSQALLDAFEWSITPSSVGTGPPG